MRWQGFVSTVLFAIVALPALAQAQTCPPGEVPSEVPGYCCWPGQRFDAVTASCLGEPQCPAGTERRGAGCVQRLAEEAGAALRAEDEAAQPPVTSQAEAAGLVSVRFVADDEDESLVVSVELPGEPTCRTPCELLLPAGRHRVTFSGARRFAKRLTIPEGAATVRVETSSSLRRGLGIAGAAVGGTAMVLSFGVLYGSAAGYADPAMDLREVEASRNRGVAIGLGGMAIGAGVLAAGLVGGIFTNRNRAVVEIDERGSGSQSGGLLGISVLPRDGGGLSVGAAFSF